MARQAVLALLFYTALQLISCGAFAAGTHMEPILRVETGMHTAMIRAVASDRAGRFLVTASDDKTVRVWEMDGDGGAFPVRIIRPPIGAGHEGKLNAVAVTASGKTIACGGWTGWDRDGAGSVYLFERADGTLTKRLTGFPEVVKGLAFSPDGTYLAVTLGGKGGLYLLRTDTWKAAFADRGYDGDAYGVAFSPDGRLATTSWDGFVRLYDRNLRLVARKRLQNSERPYGIAFSRDGNALAVGSVASPRVEVFSGKDLTFLYAPSGEGLKDGALPCVVWGEEGELYAAGSCRAREGYILRRWEAGNGAVTDRPVAAADILALAPLANGGIAFAGAAPELGVVSRKGEQLFHRGADNADFRENQPDFRVSADGATIQFGFGAAGTAQVRFSLADRLLDSAFRTPARGLSLPLVSSPVMLVENWLDSTSPTLNGIPLPLDRFETGRSLAIFPDGKGIVLGTDWSLRCFDRHGKSRWRVSTPGIAWGVNVTPDGRLVVCALGDGTIRWYRTVDGRELLALFPHRGGKRWLLWTPAGYYDASPGGEELAGWHLNNGSDQAADFFPVSRFRAVYCRPDVISRILTTGDEGKSVRLADATSGRGGETRTLAALLPPVVAIRAPADRSVIDGREATVAFAVRSPSGEPVTGVRVLVNGRPVPFKDATKGARGGLREVSVSLPAGESEIAVIAENRHAASEPATVRVSRAASDAGAEEISIQPRLHILAVGVGAYPDKEMALAYAAKDARDFASLMLRQKGGLYGDVTIRVLTDAAATREAILDGLQWLRQAGGARDTAIVFLSGHGITEKNGAYYYLPVNGDAGRLADTAIVFSEIRNTLMSLPGKAVLFVDTCHAGDVMGGKTGTNNVNALVNEFASAENGVVVFASSTGRQYSLEDEAWGNGAFTKALVEGVMGKADYTGKGRITIASLDLWLSERVQELTEGKQTPTTAKPRTIPDFPLALKSISPEEGIKKPAVSGEPQ